MSFDDEKDLEIVYNLKWKNGPKRDEKKQMSIVAVYDIPPTTLNFAVFKSYLLKNSGIAGDDVIVSYLTDKGKVYPIWSQTDFQVALYTFRNKARKGQVINLLLESTVGYSVVKGKTSSNDVETQSDNMEPASIVSICSNIETPPEWFIAGLAQLKKDLEEVLRAHVSDIVTKAVADLKPPSASAPQQNFICPHHKIRGRQERRLRKITPHTSETVSDAKDLIKSIKLENKLEKLERKATKYREKRLALHCQKSSDNGPKSSDSEAGHSTSRSRSRDKEETQLRKAEEQLRKAAEQLRRAEEFFAAEDITSKVQEQPPKVAEPPQTRMAKREDPVIMDSRPVNMQNTIPHMVAGEMYVHQFEIENCGNVEWNSEVKLEYMWGSKKLAPIEKTIPAPYLRPGQRGTINVHLQIPDEPGRYECYWQLSQLSYRFGHWLGVELIVDPIEEGALARVGDAELRDMIRQAIDLKPRKEVATNEAKNQDESSVCLIPQKEEPTKVASEAKVRFSPNKAEKQEELKKILYGACDKSKLAEILSEDEELELYSDCSYTSGSEEYVVVPSSQYPNPQTNKPEETEKPKKDDSVEADDGVEKIQDQEKPKEVLSKVLKSPDPVEASDIQAISTVCQLKKEKPKEVTPGTSSKDLDFFELTQCMKLSLEKHIKDVEQLENQPEKPVQIEAEAPAANQIQANPVADFDNNNNTGNGPRSAGSSIRLSDEDLDNIVVITVPKDEQVKEGFIYVHVDGQKVLVPKNILKSELVTAAQELERSPSATNSVGVVIDSNEGQIPPTQLEAVKDDDNSFNLNQAMNDAIISEQTDIRELLTTDGIPLPESVAVDLSTGGNREVPPEGPIDDRSNYFEAHNYMSHCSAAGSCYSEVNSQAERQNRMFVFPQDVPGYEIVNQGPYYCSSPPIPPCTVPQQQPSAPNPYMEAVPNYQQCPRNLYNIENGARETQPCAPIFPEPIPQVQQQPQQAPSPPRPVGERGEGALGVGSQVHILPETLVNGAVNVASSAINTARSVINMIKPQASGRWINGHWVSNSANTTREAHLQALAEMGFWNRDLNATLLARFDDDLNRVVAELVQ